MGPVGGLSDGPVDGEVSADNGEEVSAEVGDLDPGEDGKPGVVDHQREIISRAVAGSMNLSGGSSQAPVLKPSMATGRIWSTDFRGGSVSGPKTMGVGRLRCDWWLGERFDVPENSHLVRRKSTGGSKVLNCVLKFVRQFRIVKHSLKHDPDS